jgi:Lipocalin-like domain
MTASNPLLGTWKLVSFQFAIEDTGERGDVYDAHPIGILILTERRFTTILTAGNQPPEADSAALFDRMMAYSGNYRIEAEKIIVSVDIAWHPSWRGTEQTRFYKLDGDKLSISTAPQHHPKFADKLVRGIVVWQKD